MDDGPRSANAREERLAAKLRENLRRRKVQARAIAGSSAEAKSADLPSPEPRDSPAGTALPKEPPKS